MAEEHKCGLKWGCTYERFAGETYVCVKTSKKHVCDRKCNAKETTDSGLIRCDVSGKIFGGIIAGNDESDDEENEENEVLTEIREVPKTRKQNVEHIAETAIRLLIDQDYVPYYTQELARLYRAEYLGGEIGVKRPKTINVRTFCVGTLYLMKENNEYLSTRLPKTHELPTGIKRKMITDGIEIWKTRADDSDTVFKSHEEIVAEFTKHKAFLDENTLAI